MNEQEFDNLIRMAVEIDELERSALAFDEADRRDVTIPIRRAGGMQRPRRYLLSAATAAAVILALLPTLSNESPTPSANDTPFEIAYCPTVPQLNGIRIDRFEPSSPRECAVLAIFRAWHTDCDCLAWQLYEWDDGRPLAELTPEKVHEIMLDVTDAPPLEQLLVIAVAKNPNDLPRSESDTHDLLTCLNKVTPSSDLSDNAAAYASAVRSCLPDSVQIVPQSFCVE